MAKKPASPIPQEGIYDARELGAPKMFVLGLQHMFAMFGATVLVPVLTGLPVSTTLLFAGLGTLLFHLISKGKVPAFLGSSFAFIGGYAAVAALFSGDSANWIPYAGVGVICAGLLYAILSALVKAFGAARVMRYFPPIVTGPVIICIGLTLANSAINNCASNWLVALFAIVIVIAANIWGKGMIKIIPILLGVLGSYLFALIIDPSVREGVAAAVSEAKWIGLPVAGENTVFSLFKSCDGGKLVSAIAIMMPVALATMVEHIGDVCAISSTVGKNYVVDPGLHRTLLGDGCATALAAVFGAPANTTYGENTGVLALSKVYDPRVIRIAAVLAVLFSFCPKFEALIHAMPAATIGGVSLILYGMISAVGVRNVVENKVDFTKSRNVIVAAMILGLTLGVHFSGSLGADTLNSVNGALGFTIGSVSIKMSGLAVGALVGIILNAVLPGKDYTFGQDLQGDTSVNFKV